jgi:alcohol dehydrogenase class IV
MQFEFATATRILFGPGRMAEAAPLVASLGRRPMIVTAKHLAHTPVFLEQLQAKGLEPVTFSVPGEPEVSTVVRGVGQAREEGCDMVVGLGGGSALDAGKAIAAIMTNQGDLLDYLEVIGRGRPITIPPAPYVAIPTTSGTGTEVTRNAVIASPEYGVKVSLRSPYMLPRAAIVDPELTYSVPPAITANTGLDALTQLIEPFACNRANPLVDAICREGILRVAVSLRRVFTDGSDPEAREGMSLASLFGGLALANAGLGAVHGLAAPLGGLTHAPHGAVCARLLPFVMETNVRALESRAPASPALARYDEVGRLLTGDPKAAAADAVRWVHSVCAELSILPLARHGLVESDIPVIVTQAQRASSMKANPVPLTDLELTDILTLALN